MVSSSLVNLDRHSLTLLDYNVDCWLYFTHSPISILTAGYNVE
jgi:hypothetical protein